jgi:DNA mismatch endonuclease, patch repair protein
MVVLPKRVRQSSSKLVRRTFPDVPSAIRLRMAKIKKKDTRPELLVRRIAHRLGYRFRLHRADLPGTPDVVFPRYRAVINVHGCFWHRHNCRLAGKLPSKRREYWLPKLKRNVERDAANRRELRKLGWRYLTVWECEIRDIEALTHRVRVFLDR